jgi:predicted nucleic-acid-binding Zn-ribbon protein
MPVYKGAEMKKGICPRCQSTRVFTAQELPLKGGPFGSNSIPVSLTSMAALDNYVCLDCGLVERYVADPQKLEEIGRRWTQVGDAV